MFVKPKELAKTMVADLVKQILDVNMIEIIVIFNVVKEKEENKLLGTELGVHRHDTEDPMEEIICVTIGIVVLPKGNVD